MSNVKLSLEQCHDMAKRALMNNGADDLNAGSVADTVTAAEGDRCHSHGLFRVPGYIASLKSGKVNGKSRPKAERIAPSVVRVDGDRGYAPLALKVGRDPLASAARETGIAVLAVTRTHHFAALWPETSALAEMGLCAFACTSYMPVMAPAGGNKPFFGTNPIAFAWPRKDKPPMVFDQATAAMARGEIQIAAREGKTVPETAGIGPDGKQTSDPNAILKGAQLPFGGYKGSALALMVELLAGPLIAEVASFEAAEADNKDGGPSTGGEFVMAIDPTKLGAGEGVYAHGERVFAKLLEQDGTRLPSARRYQARLETPTTGIEIPQSLYDRIVADGKL